MQLFREAGVDMRRQVDSGGDLWVGRVDFCHAELPLVVEIQSEAYHSALLDRRSDAARVAALAAAGFDHYEVSNFARPGRRSRHNSSYWSGVAYAGLGPAAHEFDGRRRRWNAAAYAAWVERLGRGVDPIEGSESLDEANRAAETVYLGLRTTSGLELLPGEEARVAPWLSAGWATVDGGLLRLTPTGWLRLDSLAATLTVARSR